MQIKPFPRKIGRLIDNIEIEITPEGEDDEYLPFPMSYKEPDEPSPVDTLRELVKELESFDPMSGTSAPARDEAMNTLSEMERHMREFQKQSAKLKRLLSRYH